MSETLMPSLRRFRTVLAGDLAYHARRPLFIVWALILVAQRLGNVERGDADPIRRFDGRGDQGLLTSEFAVAKQLSILTLLFYGFFVAVAAGMTVIQDDQWRLGELLHATPLRPGEYIWAKFAAVLAGCLIILGFHLAAMVFFNHVLPNSEAQEIRGPLLRAQLSQARAAVLAADDRLPGGNLVRGRRVDAAGPSWSSSCRWRSCWSTASSSGNGRRAGSTRGSMTS